MLEQAPVTTYILVVCHEVPYSNYYIRYHWLSHRKSALMNVNHFGIVFSISLILVILTYVFLTTVGTSVIPETNTVPQTLAEYCEKLNLKC